MIYSEAISAGKGNLIPIAFWSDMLIYIALFVGKQLDLLVYARLFLPSSIQDKTFNGKLQQKELEWQSEQDQIQKRFSAEKASLESQLKSSKVEDVKLKDKLMEAEAVSMVSRKSISKKLNRSIINNV